jgi:hypothetical protein
MYPSLHALGGMAINKGNGGQNVAPLGVNAPGGMNAQKGYQNGGRLPLQQFAAVGQPNPAMNLPAAEVTLPELLAQIEAARQYFGGVKGETAQSNSNFDANVLGIDSPYMRGLRY